jgi:hypothetical protein
MNKMKSKASYCHLTSSDYAGHLQLISILNDISIRMVLPRVTDNDYIWIRLDEMIMDQLDLAHPALRG